MDKEIALLFSDVVDSTLLNARWGDEVMAHLWLAHDGTARKLIRDCEGREVGRSDGFLAIFPDASKAVEFANLYHRCLAAMQPCLEARVGIHVGPINLRENTAADTEQGATRFDIDGVALPIVSRIMSVALGRQTLLSDSALRALGPTQLRTQSHGYWRLKGLPVPIELIEIGETTAPFVPPADSAKAYRVTQVDATWIPVAKLPNTLPAERDAFVGRAAQLQSLAALLDENARLVTVVGIGGIGKTRLAVRFARSWLGDYPGGAWFCDLSAARAPEGIIQAVALGLDVPLGRSDPVQQLGSAIAGRDECLIILDNFEQVARYAEETLGTWLERAPQARFIATSREVLGITGEQTFVLGPLDGDEAAEMFRQRSRASGLRGILKTTDETAVGPLVELLDRLPLAIELAAARTRFMSPDVLLKRMGDRFKVLASRGGRRDRQATLRATLDWSWDLLSATEKVALAQLSVFEGGFGLAAAEAVIDVSSVEPRADATTLLQALLDKSLIFQRSDARLDLLSTVHEYVAERLKEQPAYALLQAQHRHGQYFAALSRNDAVTLCTERANLVVAARRAAASGDSVTATAALECAWIAIKLRGPFIAAFELAETVRAMSDLDQASSARIARIAGWSLRALGQAARAEARLTDALGKAKGASDHECEGQVHYLLGDVYFNQGNIQAAKAEYESALEVASELNDLALECDARNGLGNLCRQLGRTDEARAQYELTLKAARTAGDRRWEGGTLGNLGTVCIDQGDKVGAEGHFQSALRFARELGDRQWEGNTLCNLGLMHQEQGQLESATIELHAALVIARELGHTRLECIVLCNLGIVLDASGEFEEAKEQYKAALEMALIQGDRRTEGQILGYLGVLHFRLGRYEEGRACLENGEKRLNEVSDQLSLAILYCGRAEGECLAGNKSDAASALASAEKLASTLRAEGGTELGTALSRARGLLAQ